LILGLSKCTECEGGVGTPGNPYCNAVQLAIPVPCTTACGMKKDAKGIQKYCALDGTDTYKDASGKLICNLDVECYCDDTDECNKPKDFGLSPTGTGGGGTGTGGGGTGGTTPSPCKGSLPTASPATSVLSWIMVSVVVWAYLP